MRNGKAPAVQVLRLYLRGCESRPDQWHLIIAFLISQTEETQIVGSDDYGYVKIPKLWVHFKEIEGGDDIQYCDGTDVNIVTLNTFKLEQFGISESEYAALETVQISTSIY